MLNFRLQWLETIDPLSQMIFMGFGRRDVLNLRGELDLRLKLKIIFIELFFKCSLDQTNPNNSNSLIQYRSPLLLKNLEAIAVGFQLSTVDCSRARIVTFNTCFSKPLLYFRSVDL